MIEQNRVTYYYNVIYYSFRLIKLILNIVNFYFSIPKESTHKQENLFIFCSEAMMMIF